MKYSLIALAATAICGASAASHNHRRHNHNDIFKRFEQKADDCKCSTYVTSYVVPVTSMFSPVVSWLVVSSLTRKPSLPHRDRYCRARLRDRHPQGDWYLRNRLAC